MGMKTANNLSTFKNTKELMREVKYNSLVRMITLAQKQLNPFNYHLSFDAKKRLRWFYLLYHEQGSNVTRTAKKIGITRQWLSELKSVFENNNRDPRKLEPKSKAPHKTENRKRITKWVKDDLLHFIDDRR